jgi:hypothetical protein
MSTVDNITGIDFSHLDSVISKLAIRGHNPLVKPNCKSELFCKLSLSNSTVDVQSAFDVVQHTILFDKLLDQNIHPDLWLLVKNLYEGLTSKVNIQYS